MYLLFCGQLHTMQTELHSVSCLYRVDATVASTRYRQTNVRQKTKPDLRVSDHTKPDWSFAVIWSIIGIQVHWWHVLPAATLPNIIPLPTMNARGRCLQTSLNCWSVEHSVLIVRPTPADLFLRLHEQLWNSSAWGR